MRSLKVELEDQSLLVFEENEARLCTIQEQEAVRYLFNCQSLTDTCISHTSWRFESIEHRILELKK